MPFQRNLTAFAAAALFSGVAATGWASPSVASVNDEPVLVHGFVKTGGQPSAAEVLVELWPSSETLAAIPVGGVVNTYKLPAVPAAGNGSFEVKLAVADVPPGFMSADGKVDVVVTPRTNGKGKPWHATAVGDPTAPEKGWRTVNSKASDVARKRADARSGLDVVLDTADGVVSREAADDPAEWQNAVPASSQRACWWNKTGNIYDANATVGRINTASTNLAPGKMKYGYNSNHTLGIAYSNGFGYSASGTSTKTAGGGWDTGHTSASREYRTKWRYRQYLYDCGGAKWVPEAHITGPTSVAISTTLYSHACSTYRAGYTFTRESGANATFQNGVSVAGVGLTSQTGYNTSTETGYYFKSLGAMCASNSNGLWGAPGISARY